MQTKPEEQEITAHERLSEVGTLLATAICRIKARKTNENRDFLLDFTATPSIHGEALNEGKNYE